MKIFLIIFCIFYSFTFNTSSFTYASENTGNTYAKVDDDCLLFKTTDTELILYSNIHFTIPKGYFVTIITSITSEVVKVKYGAFTGFVKTSKIKTVSGTPKKPTLENITFSIKESSSTQIRKTPTTDEQDNILHIIPSATTNIKYIAEVSGEIPPSGSSHTWYFAEYSPESDPVSVYYGYIYSEKTENLTVIPENHEFESELLHSDNQTTIEENYIHLSGGVKAVLIVIISLPMLIIFIILLVSTKRNKNDKNIFSEKQFFRKNKQKTMKNDEILPNFPTYDFDDDDLL